MKTGKTRKGGDFTGTTYEEIISLALVTIRDWKLDKLLEACRKRESEVDGEIDGEIDGENRFLRYMSGFLIRGIALFDCCDFDLSERDDEKFCFNFFLQDKEKDILAECVVIRWLEKEIQDVTQITGMLQNGKEANRHSEAMLFEKKQLSLAAKLEKLDRDLERYSNKYGKGGWCW